MQRSLQGLPGTELERKRKDALAFSRNVEIKNNDNPASVKTKVEGQSWHFAADLYPPRVSDNERSRLDFFSTLK